MAADDYSCRLLLKRLRQVTGAQWFKASLGNIARLSLQKQRKRSGDVAEESPWLAEAKPGIWSSEQKEGKRRGGRGGRVERKERGKK